MGHIFVLHVKNDEQNIGITGGIASGKSTVVAEIRKQGYQVIDADQVCA